MTNPTPSPRTRKVRSDAVRNERDLVVAVGELLREDPRSATMPAVAERAGLSLATAYRYFPTLDLLHRRFMLSVVEEVFDDTKDLAGSGRERFAAILRRWLRAIDEYGPAMVHVRSREGFLTRLQHEEPQTVVLGRIWGGAIRQMMAEEGVAEERFPLALALYNSLLNSREVLDLREAGGMDDAQLAEHLLRVYAAALTGLAPDHHIVHRGEAH